jgi:hypothetical protein
MNGAKTLADSMAEQASAELAAKALKDIREKFLAAEKEAALQARRPKPKPKLPTTIDEVRALDSATLRMFLQTNRAEIEGIFQKEERRKNRETLRQQLLEEELD